MALVREPPQRRRYIVDVEAKVDADVDVAVAVIGGTVNGDIVARERFSIERGKDSQICTVEMETEGLQASAVGV